jgi:hypothetical protein
MPPDGDAERAEERDEQEQLEELRRSFTSLGRRLGAPPNKAVEVGPPVPERARPGDPSPPAGAGLEVHAWLPPAREPAAAPVETVFTVADDAAEGPPPVEVAAPAPRRRWLVVAGLLLTLALGLGAGYLLHQPAGRAAAAPSGAVPATSTPAAPRAATAPTTMPAKVVVPASCLRAAQYGDKVIDLLVRNVRDQRLGLALKTYTLASQTCRKEASRR